MEIEIRTEIFLGMRGMCNSITYPTLVSLAYLYSEIVGLTLFLVTDIRDIIDWGLREGLINEEEHYRFKNWWVKENDA